MIVFHSGHFILLLEPSPPSPSVTFRPALLRPETSDSEAHKADLHAGGNPVRKQPCRRHHAPPLSGSLPSKRRRVDARVGHFPVPGLHIQARSVPSYCSIPPVVPPEPSLFTFLPILPLPHSVSHLLHGVGLLFLHLQFHSRDSPSY